MPDRSRRRPRDSNQLAKLIVDIATGETVEEPDSSAPEKNAAAVELGRRGGLKGGRVRAERLSAEERSDSARKAAQARWDKPKNRKDGPKPN
jgi:hypothetical protein